MAELNTLEREALKRLTIGCLHLLAGRASLEFPGSTRAAPSTKVTVLLVPPGPLQSEDAVWFPFTVSGDYWHKVAAPVLKDPGIQALLLGTRDVAENKLTESLLATAQAEGYLPQGIPTAPVVLDAPGEPVDRSRLG